MKQKTSIRILRQSPITGFLSLFLLAVATAVALFVPAVTSASDDALSQYSNQSGNVAGNEKIYSETPVLNADEPFRQSAMVTPTPTFIRRVNFPLNDFVYSVATQTMYLSVPSSAGVGRGNTITKVNPVSGAIGSSVFIGSEPNRMAISDDGQTIYTKLDGAYAIRRFDVPTQTANLQFVPQSPFVYTDDMAVQPGNSQVIALSNNEGVVIYDNGVQRPVYSEGGAYAINSIAFANATTLYGYDNESSGFELVRFTVTDSGVTGVNMGYNLISGFGVRIKYANGLIYSTGGRVVSAATGQFVGSFQTYGSTMAIDQATGRVFFMSENILTAYDMNTFAQIGSITLPTLTGTPYGLVRWGENGLAFRTSGSGSSGSTNSQLYLIQSTLVNSTAAVPTGIQIGSQNLSSSESGGGQQITITRTGDLSAASTVDYATQDGTATAGADYTATAGTLVFAPEEASKTITVPIINDNVFEDSESFNFTLSNPTGQGSVTLTYPSAATLTIYDNDSQPYVSAQNNSVNEPPVIGATTNALVTVRLTNPTTQTATVSYTTANGTATAGSDYVAASGVLTFAPLETTKTIAVQILGDDNLSESNETFTVNFSNAVNASLSNPQVTTTIINNPTAASRRSKFDYDGDGKADISVFRPSNGAWYLLQSASGFAGITFGINDDLITPADYDGDGKTDVAVFRPSNGVWYLQRSQAGFTAVSFGISGDIPVPADYDGDGRADIAVFRPSNGTWYLQRSQSGFTAVGFGQTGDTPVPADYDGDGRADIALNRSGTWYLQRSQLGFTGIAFGEATDKLVPADYDGDGKTDVAVFRPSTGYWYLLQSTTGFAGISFGIATDLPVPADYDGDGKTDVAVFRDGIWYLNRSASGFTGISFGAASDKPIQNAFIP